MDNGDFLLGSQRSWRGESVRRARRAAVCRCACATNFLLTQRGHAAPVAERGMVRWWPMPVELSRLAGEFA